MDYMRTSQKPDFVFKEFLTKWLPIAIGSLLLLVVLSGVLIGAQALINDIDLGELEEVQEFLAVWEGLSPQPTQYTFDFTQTPTPTLLPPENAGTCQENVMFMDAEYNQIRLPSIIRQGEKWCIGASWEYFQKLMEVELNINDFSRKLAEIALSQGYHAEGGIATAFKGAIMSAMDEFEEESHGIITWPSVSQVQQTTPGDIDAGLVAKEGEGEGGGEGGWTPPVNQPTPEPPAPTNTPINTPINTPTVEHTPFPTQTPTPDIATQVADEGEPERLKNLSSADLIVKTSGGMDLWNLPGIDSVELKSVYSQDWQTDVLLGFAPNYANAEYFFRVTSTQALKSNAWQAGCSLFNEAGSMIYEHPTLTSGLKFAYQTTNGTKYYSFRAGKVQANYCTYFPPPTPLPTNTPAPLPTKTPTPAPTNLVGATDVPTQAPVCHTSFNWQDLLASPIEWVDSSDTLLTEWNPSDPTPVFVGNGSGIHYCIYGLPEKFEGKEWGSPKYISLTGGEILTASYQIPGTEIFVSPVW